MVDVAVSPSPSVTVKVALVGGTGLVVTASAVNEYEPSAFTLMKPAPMSIACEKPSRAEHQRRAVDVRDRGAVGAAGEVQRPGHRGAFRDVLRGFGSRPSAHRRRR